MTQLLLLACISPSLRLSSGFLSLLERLVLLGAVPLGDQNQNNSKAASRDDGTATRLVVGFLIPQKEVRREPVRNRRDAVGIGNESSTLSARTWNDGRLPRDLNLCPDSQSRGSAKRYSGRYSR